MSGTYRMADVRATYPQRSAWWTVLLVDPIAGRLLLPIANRTSITPSQLTVLSAVIGFGAAGAFLEGSGLGLIIGAALFYVSYLIDCMDGKLARLKGAVSVFGAWLDYVLDRFKVAACTVGLMAGQFRQTDREIYLYLGIAVLFGEMFRQLHAAYSRALQAKLPPSGHLSTGTSRHRRTSRAYDRFRSAVLARRIRPHLWSGIEFEMFVFIVGPLSGAVVPVTVASLIMLGLFESMMIGKLYRTTRRCDEAANPVVNGDAQRSDGPTEGPAAASSLSTYSGG